MSHVLPPAGHPAREMFDVTDLVAVSTGKRPVHCNRHAVRKLAMRALEATPAADRMVYFYVRGDTDELQLISVGRRGGFKVEWRFGPITRATRLA